MSSTRSPSRRRGRTRSTRVPACCSPRTASRTAATMTTCSSATTWRSLAQRSSPSGALQCHSHSTAPRRTRPASKPNFECMSNWLTSSAERGLQERTHPPECTFGAAHAVHGPALGVSSSDQHASRATARHPARRSDSRDGPVSAHARLHAAAARCRPCTLPRAAPHATLGDEFRDSLKLTGNTL